MWEAVVIHAVKKLLTNNYELSYQLVTKIILLKVVAESQVPTVTICHSTFNHIEQMFLGILVFQFESYESVKLLADSRYSYPSFSHLPLLFYILDISLLI